MKCPTDETLLLLVDAELHEMEREEVAAHLAYCSACRARADEMAAVNAMARSALTSIALDGLHLSSMRHGRRISGPLKLAAAAVVLVGVSVAAWLCVKTTRDPQIATVGQIRHRDQPASPATAPRDVIADKAFKQWASGLRTKRVRRVPMEDVANFRAPEIPPVRSSVQDDGFIDTRG